MSTSVGNLAVILSANSAPLAAGLAQAKLQIAQYQHSIQQMRNEAAAQRPDKSDEFGIGSSIAGRLGPAALFAGASVAATAFAHKAMSVANANESAAVSFKLLTGSGEQSKKMLDDLQAFSIRAGVGLDEARRSAVNLMAAGIGQERVIPVLESLRKLSIGTGADMGRIALAFKQVSASGRLMTEEINQFSEAGFPIKEFAKTLGVPITELRKLASEGKVTSDVMVKTFERLTTGSGQFAKAIEMNAETVNGKLDTLSASWDKFAGKVGESFSGGAKTVLDSLNRGLDALSKLTGGNAAPVIYRSDQVGGAQAQHEAYKQSEEEFRQFHIRMNKNPFTAWNWGEERPNVQSGLGGGGTFSLRPLMDRAGSAIGNAYGKLGADKAAAVFEDVKKFATETKAALAAPIPELLKN